MTGDRMINLARTPANDEFRSKYYQQNRLQTVEQVWPPTQFFPFVKKSLTCHRGNIILFHSSKQLPRLHLGPLKEFFELTQRPSRAINLPCASLPELQ